jgi:hypothetical protein
VAGFVKGDVVVVPFPFSDLTNAKRRPSRLTLAPPGRYLFPMVAEIHPVLTDMAPSKAPPKPRPGFLLD